MSITLSTDFRFLGDRTYIHATTLLSAFIQTVELDGVQDIVVKRLKFQRPAHSNGTLVVSSEKIDDAAAEAANCTFVATADQATWRGYFMEQGKPVSGKLRVDYPIEALEARAFGGSCRISPANRDDLIRTLVEANKRFHERSLDPDAKPVVRFGYLESWKVPARDFAFTGELKVENRIAKRTDTGYMTINRLTYNDGRGQSDSLTLCFNVACEGAPR